MEDSLPDPVLVEGPDVDLEPSGGSFDRCNKSLATYSPSLQILV
jgi:hypothetical protein